MFEPEETTVTEENAALVEYTNDWNQLVAEYNAALADGTLPEEE